MATSGSTDYSINREQIFQEALEILNVYDPISTLSSEDMFSCARTLNMMLKAWTSDGLQLWAQKEVALFLAKDQITYTLGASGDHWAETYAKTAVATAGVALDTTVVVDDTTGMTAADYVGVELDDGTMHWTTVSSVTNATDFVLTVALPSAAAVDSVVRYYTNKMPKPFRIMKDPVRYLEATGSEIPLIMVDRARYWNLGNKTTVGAVNQLYFDPRRDVSELTVYPSPDSSVDYLKLVAHFAFEDMDNQADDLDFPQYWYESVVWNLSVRLMYKFGGAVTQDRRREIRSIAKTMKEDALNFDTEDNSIFFQPQRANRS